MKVFLVRGMKDDEERTFIVNASSLNKAANLGGPHFHIEELDLSSEKVVLSFSSLQA